MPAQIEVHCQIRRRLDDVSTAGAGNKIERSKRSWMLSFKFPWRRSPKSLARARRIPLIEGLESRQLLSGSPVLTGIRISRTCRQGVRHCSKLRQFAGHRLGAGYVQLHLWPSPREKLEQRDRSRHHPRFPRHSHDPRGQGWQGPIPGRAIR